MNGNKNELELDPHNEIDLVEADEQNETTRTVSVSKGAPDSQNFTSNRIS